MRRNFHTTFSMNFSFFLSAIRKQLVVLGFLFCVWPVVGAEPGAPFTLRVVSWNLEWFPGKSMQPTSETETAQMLAVQTAMKEIAPDIFVVSELRDWAALHDVVSVVPGLEVNVVSAFPTAETGELWLQQVAIASRLRCIAAWAEPFRPTIPALSRGFAFAALQEPGTNRLILVYSVHLKSNRARNQEETETNFRLRDESIRQIFAHMDTMKSVMFKNAEIAGWILAGDFNTNHDGQFGDRVVETIEAGGFWNTWKTTPREKRLTWRGNDRFEPTTFDYIFLSGFGNPSAVLLETPRETSDHEVVAVEIPVGKP